METWQIVFDALTILALLAGPVIAVRITRQLDDRKERRDRRLSVFRDLMSSRTYQVSWQHVQALMRVPEIMATLIPEILACLKEGQNGGTIVCRNPEYTIDGSAEAG